MEIENNYPKRLFNIYGDQFGTGFAGNVWDDNATCPCLMTMNGGNRQPIIPTESKYRVRKLTETECWRLMGVKDEDTAKVAKHQSMSSMYHLAGDSIVTACLMAIFGEIVGVDWKEKISDIYGGIDGIDRNT